MFICLRPQEKFVFLGKDCLKDVDFSSVAEDVVSVEFNQTTSLGVVTKATDQGLVLEDLDSLKDYEVVLELAVNALHAQNNPKTYYSTIIKPGLSLGAPVVVTALGWPQPEDTTEQIPLPQPDEYSKLYWTGRRFVWWCFPPNLKLTEAKAAYVSEINKQTYEILQPSDWYAVRQLETGQLTPEAIVSWRSAVRSAARSKISELDEVTSKAALNALVKSEAFRLWPTSP